MGRTTALYITTTASASSMFHTICRFTCHVVPRNQDSAWLLIKSDQHVWGTPMENEKWSQHPWNSTPCSQLDWIRYCWKAERTMLWKTTSLHIYQNSSAGYWWSNSEAMRLGLSDNLQPIRLSSGADSEPFYRVKHRGWNELYIASLGVLKRDFNNRIKLKYCFNLTKLLLKTYEYISLV